MNSQHPTIGNASSPGTGLSKQGPAPSKLVAIETSPAAFVFHYTRGSEAWKVELPKAVCSTLSKVASESMPLAAHSTSAIRELRRFGFLRLGPQGDVTEPVTLSDEGAQLARGLTELETANPNTQRFLITEPQ